MLSRQVTLFREVQSFRLLALATVGSAFGTWLAFVALTIDVYDRTGSAVWVSALLIADFLPASYRSDQIPNPFQPCPQVISRRAVSDP